MPDATSPRWSHTERAITEISLMMVLVLLSSLLLTQYQTFYQMSLLMQDQILSHTASRAADNQAITMDLPSSKLPGTPSLQCQQGTAVAGKIKRSSFHCMLASPPLHLPGYFSSFQALFERSTACPRRTRTLPAPSGWTRRSLYECNQIPAEVDAPVVVGGDLLRQQDLSVNAPPENLIAARGSIALSSLQLAADTTIIALGDIAIGSIRNVGDNPAHLLLIAPAGTIEILSATASVSVTVVSRYDRVPALIPRKPLRKSRFVTLSPFLSLGLLPTDIAVAE